MTKYIMMCMNVKFHQGLVKVHQLCKECRQKYQTSVHSHLSKFVLKPSRDRKGRGNSAIPFNSRQLAEVLMPLFMKLGSWQVFSKGRFYCWERGAEMKVRNALLIDLLFVGQFL